MSELNNDEPNNQVDATSTDGETAGGLTVSELRDWLRDWVAQATGVPADQISDDRPMEEFGLSSRDAVALAADVEDKTGVILTATVAYNHPTIAMLATRIIEGDPDEASTRRRPLLGARAQRRRRHRHRRALHAIPEGRSVAGVDVGGLIEGRDGISDLPDDRWTEFKADPRMAEVLEKRNLRGGYLDDVKSFDADFFQMSPREVEMVDPQQRLALELTWEALEHARIPPAISRAAASAFSSAPRPTTTS